MEKLAVGASTVTTSCLFPTPGLSKSFEPLQSGLNACFSMLRNGCFSSSSHHTTISLSFSTSTRGRNSALKIISKKRGDKYKKKQKLDTHSFVARPDESTVPFPEAVLKPKKFQEDGKLMPDFADEEEEQLFEYLNLQLESDLKLERKRHYEIVYLIHQNFKNEVENVNSKVQDFLKEKQGRVWRFSDWGMRRLAYKIRKATHAHYILMNFELEAKWINDLKTMLDQDERVIRHLMIRRDKAITEDCPPPPEFHTIQGNMDEHEAGEVDLEYDNEYDEDYAEEEDEEWDDEDDELDVIDVQDCYDDGNEDGVEDASVLINHTDGEIRTGNDQTHLMKKAGGVYLDTEKTIR